MQPVVTIRNVVIPIEDNRLTVAPPTPIVGHIRGEPTGFIRVFMPVDGPGSGDAFHREIRGNFHFDTIFVPARRTGGVGRAFGIQRRGRDG